MGRHQYQRSPRRYHWTEEDDRRITEKLTKHYATDAMILAGKPPLEWLLEMRRIYRSIMENGADPVCNPDPKTREWYRRALAGSDERWREVLQLADEMIAEHARRAEQRKVS